MTNAEFHYSGTNEKNALFLTYIIIIILPFVLLYWMAPFIADLTISMDYPLHPITEQMELQFSLETGSFPLYAPGYHQGHSSAALTLGQLYHPISRIATIMPGYWDGKALEWNTFLRMLFLGLTQMALFVFLRQVRLNMVYSFVLSLITVYNLRMLEAMRYGASLEAFTGHLLLCAMIGRYCISRSGWIGPLAITGLTYMLVCSGHPPMMFYGFFGAVLFLIVIPFFLSVMLPDNDFNMQSAIKFWKRAGLFMLFGVLLASIYVVPLKFEFVNENITYTTSDIQPNMGQDTPAGALNNFFMPFAASLLDSFGGSSLILIALLLPSLLFFRVKIPSVIWIIWVVLIYTMLFILGPSTPVFKLAWDYFPLMSSLGQVGRIAIIIPTILMLLMAWIINAEASPVHMWGVSVSITPVRILGSIALILMPVYLGGLFFLKPDFGHFIPHSIRNIPFWIEAASVFGGLLSLTALVSYNRHSHIARTIGISLCIVVLFQIGIIMKYGMWVEKKEDKPTFEQLAAQKQKTLDYSFHDCPNTQHHVVMEHLSHTFMEPFLGKIFAQVSPAASQEDAYVQMKKQRIPQQIFVEKFDSGKAGVITDGAKYMDKGNVKLVYSSYNRLMFQVNSQSPALFGLSYPYTGHWNARVNGKMVSVYRANGAANAVEIPAGESLVEFRYWSSAFLWGTLLTCFTFAGVGLYVLAGTLGGYLRVIGMIIVITAGTSGFILWYNSLYSGDNLNTEYQWSYIPPESPMNIAYGKKTSGYTLPSLSYLHWHSSNAVDGDTRSGSGFPLGVSDDSALIVDLNQNESIRSIMLYGDIRDLPEIYLSQNGIKWERVAPVILEKSSKSPLSIIFDEPRFKRFIKVKASGTDIFIDELEAYKPY